MRCVRCGNTDKNLFYEDDFGMYCRKCICFNRINIGTKLKTISLPKAAKEVTYHLQYTLTPQQKQISQQCISYLENHENILIHACCGSGKTEMIIPVIQHFINKGYCIGMAISRRQVVLELTNRLKKVFCDLDIIAVCDGYTSKTKAEFIICTTHQLYRYYKAFDILILDEVDAFPFKNNELLYTIAHNSYRKNYLCLSATLDKHLITKIKQKELKVLQLYQRYHGRKLIVPKKRKLPFLLQIIYLLLWLNKHKHLTCLIFVATKKRCAQMQKLLNYFFETYAITSNSTQKELIIENLKKAKRRILVTTTIMERGITIDDACVFVLESDHTVFDEATLIQIAGRVDRTLKTFYGEVIFCFSIQTKAIKNCVQTIKAMNR